MKQLQKEKLRSSSLPLPCARWWQKKWTNSLAAPPFSKSDIQNPLHLFPNKQQYFGIRSEKILETRIPLTTIWLGFSLAFFELQSSPSVDAGERAFSRPSSHCHPQPCNCKHRPARRSVLLFKNELTRYHTEAMWYLYALPKAAPLIVARNGFSVTDRHLSWALPCSRM